jgi:hypothetical protein
MKQPEAEHPTIVSNEFAEESRKEQELRNSDPEDLKKKDVLLNTENIQVFQIVDVLQNHPLTAREYARIYDSLLILGFIS